MIGYFQRAPTKLIPKFGTFGASFFFEWEQGNPYRIAGFLRTLGYEGLGPLPQERRIQFTALAALNAALAAQGKHSEGGRYRIRSSLATIPLSRGRVSASGSHTKASIL